MTYALLILWTATAQAAESRTATPALCTAPATVIVPYSSDERAQKAQLEAMRDQLAKAEEQAGMPDHAVAALMVSDHPELTSLVRVNQRRADRGVRKAKIEVFASPREGETMVAVVLNIRNPRHERTWEPREALVKTAPPPLPSPKYRRQPVRWLEPIPAALRSVPARIAPGQPARIALVFDKNDVDLDGGPVVVELLRQGKWEFELTLRPSDLVPSSKIEGPL